MVGLWSCVYCEGVWLSKSDLTRRAALPRASAPTESEKLLRHQSKLPLTCPSCLNQEFIEYRAEEHAQVHECTKCGSVFLPKESAARLSEALGADKWNFAKSLFDSDTRTKADLALGVAGIVLLLFS